VVRCAGTEVRQPAHEKGPVYPQWKEGRDSLDCEVGAWLVQEVREEATLAA